MPVSNKALPDVRHTGRTSCPASAALWSNAGTVALVSQKPRPDGPTTFFWGGGLRARALVFRQPLLSACSSPQAPAAAVGWRSRVCGDEV